MTPARKRNLMRLPAVILLRIPLLAPFWAVSELGRWAGEAGQWLGHRLPGLERERVNRADATKGASDV